MVRLADYVSPQRKSQKYDMIYDRPWYTVTASHHTHPPSARHYLSLLFSLRACSGMRTHADVCVC